MIPGYSQVKQKDFVGQDTIMCAIVKHLVNLKTQLFHHFWFLKELSVLSEASLSKKGGVYLTGLLAVRGCVAIPWLSGGKAGYRHTVQNSVFFFTIGFTQTRIMHPYKQFTKFNPLLLTKQKTALKADRSAQTNAFDVVASHITSFSIFGQFGTQNCGRNSK